MDWIELILDFIARVAWPIVLLIVAFSFKDQFGALMGRVKTGQVAGAKFEFGAASAKLNSSLDEVSAELKELREMVASRPEGEGDAEDGVPEIDYDAFWDAVSGNLSDVQNKVAEARGSAKTLMLHGFEPESLSRLERDILDYLYHEQSGREYPITTGELSDYYDVTPLMLQTILHKLNVRGFVFLLPEKKIADTGCMLTDVGEAVAQYLVQ